MERFILYLVPYFLPPTMPPMLQLHASWRMPIPLASNGRCRLRYSPHCQHTTLSHRVVGARHCGPLERKLGRCQVGTRPFHFLVCITGCFSMILKVHVYLVLTRASSNFKTRVAKATHSENIFLEVTWVMIVVQKQRMTHGSVQK